MEDVVNQRVDVRNDLRGIQRLVISPHWLTIVIQKELFKIPSDVILMIRIIIQFVRGLELLPDRWTAVLEECIDWVLILPVDI